MTREEWRDRAVKHGVEIIKLKELLRELKRYFDKDGKYYIEKRILLEINKVLGEDR